jgi:hypothetical protein
MFISILRCQRDQNINLTSGQPILRSSYLPHHGKSRRLIGYISLLRGCLIRLGFAGNKKNIYIEDLQDSRTRKHLGIAQNLEAALLYLRQEHEPRRLWIDAICVDQKNLTERSCQVQRMSDIYKLAERVVVWLGPEESDSSRAMSILQDLGSSSLWMREPGSSPLLT